MTRKWHFSLASLSFKQTFEFPFLKKILMYFFKWKSKTNFVLTYNMTVVFINSTENTKRDNRGTIHIGREKEIKTKQQPSNAGTVERRRNCKNRKNILTNRRVSSRCGCVGLACHPGYMVLLFDFTSAVGGWLEVSRNRVAPHRMECKIDALAVGENILRVVGSVWFSRPRHLDWSSIVLPHILQ